MMDSSDNLKDGWIELMAINRQMRLKLEFCIQMCGMGHDLILELITSKQWIKPP